MMSVPCGSKFGTVGLPSGTRKKTLQRTKHRRRRQLYRRSLVVVVALLRLSHHSTTKEACLWSVSSLEIHQRQLQVSRRRGGFHLHLLRSRMPLDGICCCSRPAVDLRDHPGCLPTPHLLFPSSSRDCGTNNWIRSACQSLIPMAEARTVRHKTAVFVAWSFSLPLRG